MNVFRTVEQRAQAANGQRAGHRNDQEAVRSQVAGERSDYSSRVVDVFQNITCDDAFKSPIEIQVLSVACDAVYKAGLVQTLNGTQLEIDARETPGSLRESCM